MNRYLLCLSCFIFLFIRNADAQNVAWVKHLSGYYLLNVKIDAAGNKYLFGQDQSTSKFTIMKIDRDSNILWTQFINHINTTTISNIDAHGNSYIGGTVGAPGPNQPSNVDFNSGSGIDTVSIKPSGFAFFAKYNAAGVFQWVKVLRNGIPSVLNIEVNRQQNVLIQGGFSGVVNFNPNAAGGNLNSSNGGGTYISTYDSIGNFLWAKNGYNFRNPRRDLAGNIYAASGFIDSMDVGPDTTIHMVYGPGENVNITKYDNSGSLIWSKTIVTVKNPTIAQLDGFWFDVDDYGNAYAGGGFRDSIDVNPGSGKVTLFSKGDFDIFIMKIDSSGAYQWVRQIAGIGWDRFYKCPVNKLTSDVYVIGDFVLSTDFNVGSTPEIRNAVHFTVNGSNNGFVAKYDKNGNYQNVIHTPGLIIREIDIDNNTNAIYATGNKYEDSADFNRTANGQYMVYFNSTAPTNEGYLAKYNQPLSVQTISNDNINVLAYPNPVIANEVTIDMGDVYDNVNIFLTDMSGKIVSKDTRNGVRKFTFNTGELLTGFYLLQLKTIEGNAVIKLKKE